MSDIGSGLDGRLAEGTRMNGTLEFKNAVQIDGRFEGNVKSPGKLILGPTAEVDAEITVGELEVQGKLRGKVQAKNRLMIRSGGSVDGNIVTASLAIENGAIFRGSCDMPKQDSGRSGSPPPKPKLDSGSSSKDSSKPSPDAGKGSDKPGPPPSSLPKP